MKPWSLLLYFLKLGATGFGGPLAMIAQMQKDLIEERRLMPIEDFQTAVALIKSMPGPIAPQVIAFIMRSLFGFWWALGSVLLFVAPAALMMALFAEFDTSLVQVKGFVPLMKGFQGAALVLIAGALLPIAKSSAKTKEFWILIVTSLLGMGLLNVPEPVMIVLAAVLACVLHFQIFSRGTIRSFVGWEILLVCLKAGGLAFGTGVAIIPLLRTDFVQAHQWITNDQFMNSLAFAQLTPGPIAVTVTYVGYKVLGLGGAIAATLAIFAPGFINMTTWFPLAMGWLQKQNWVKIALHGAIAAIGAGILLAVSQMVQEMEKSLLVIPLLLWLISLRRPLHSGWIVIISGLCSFALGTIAQ